MTPVETSDQVIEMLCGKVRVVSVQQLAATLFRNSTSPSRAANRLARKLIKRELVESRRVTATLLASALPLTTFIPGQQGRINPQRVAYQNTLRWRIAPQPVTVLFATPKATGLFGGVTRDNRPDELEHDLHLASVFLGRSETEPSLWRNWLGECFLHEETFGGGRPDAVVRHTGVARDEVIEVLGRGYDAPKVESIVQAYRDFPLTLY